MKAKTKKPAKKRPVVAFTTSFDLYSISITSKAETPAQARKLSKAKLAKMDVSKYINPHATFTDKKV